jgi:hypothetical protein
MSERFRDTDEKENEYCGHRGDMVIITKVS